MTWHRLKRRLSEVVLWGLLGVFAASTLLGPAAPADVTAPQAVSPPAINGTTVVEVPDQATFESLVGGARGVITDLVFTGSTYTRASGLTINGNATPSASWHGVRYWASGSVTFDYGVTMGGNQTPPATGEWHGFVWDIDDIAKAPSIGGGVEAVIYTWGQSPRGMLFEDCYIRSSALRDASYDVVAIGIYTATATNSASGMTIRRCVFEDLERNAFLAGTTGATVATQPEFSNVRAERIHQLGGARGALLGANGAECAFASAQIPLSISRARVVDCGWAGALLAGTAPKQALTISDWWCDYIGPSARTLRFRGRGGVGIYLEDTDGSSVTRAYFGPHMGAGVNAEWSTDVMVTANSNITLTDCDFESFKFGALFQYATDTVVMTRCRFRQSWKSPWLSEPNSVDIDDPPNDARLYQLEDGVISKLPIELTASGGALEFPPVGWRMHPDQFAGVLTSGSVDEAVFWGRSASGTWSELADDEVSGGSLDMTVSGTGAGHMYLQNAAWAITAGRGIVMEVGLSNGGAGLSILFRQRSSAGPTVAAMRLNAAATGFEMFVGAVAEPWTPTNFPSTASEDRCLVFWQTDSAGTTSTVHLLNITTGEVAFHQWTHAAFANNSDDWMIFGNEQQFPGATNQYQETVYACGVLGDYVDSGVVARIQNPVQA